MFRIIMTMVMLVCMVSSTAFANGSFDFIETMVVGQMWKIHGDNMSYEIYPPTRAKGWW